MSKKIALMVCMSVVGFVLSGSVLAAPIQPGDNIQEELQEALILAEKNAVIELSAGVFNFTRSLSLDVDGVTLRGQGSDKTILSFKNQNAGSEGLLVTSDRVTLEHFAIEDTIGDCIKAKGSKTITFLDVRTEWTGGPKSTNGSYGLYPVECENVLIDKCIAIGASDAGIYVGQSKNIVLRRSVVKFNVAGIEIENCYNADVYENIATRNTGGILIFDLPNLPMQGGHDVRVFNNRSFDNDTKNFAPEGNIVGNVPTGTGILIMANRNVEIFGNTLSNNETANIIVSAYRGREGETVDPDYYPYPEAIHIHNNTFEGGGTKPDGPIGLIALAANGGAPLPDIVWDGRMNPEKVIDGKLPAESAIVIHDNGDADFVDLNLGAFMNDPKSATPRRDIMAHAGTLPAIAPVKIPQDS